MNTWSFPGLLRIIQTTTQRGVDLYTSPFLMIKQYHLDLHYSICSTHINYNEEKNNRISLEQEKKKSTFLENGAHTDGTHKWGRASY